MVMAHFLKRELETILYAWPCQLSQIRVTGANLSHLQRASILTRDDACFQHNQEVRVP